MVNPQDGRYADGRDARCQCKVYETCQYCRPQDGPVVPLFDGLLTQLLGAIASGSFDQNDEGDYWTAQTLCEARDAVLMLRAQAAEVARLTAERDEARAFGKRAAAIANQQLVTCAFCGAEYPTGTPRHGDGALTAHVRVCELHPMRAVEGEVLRLAAESHALTEQLRAVEAERDRLFTELLGRSNQIVNKIARLEATIGGHAALETSANSLANEVSGLLGAWWNLVVEAVGLTNVRCLERRRDEVRSALADLTRRREGTGE